LWQNDGDWLDGTAEEMAAQSRLSPAQASHEISHYLQFIAHQLEGVDPILDDIDHRHAAYLRTSLRQIRYQLGSADGSFKDRLGSLAKLLAALVMRATWNCPPNRPGLRQMPIRLPDSHSYYTPPMRRAPFNPEDVVLPTLATR
jgi:hypothetical protein